MEMKRHSGSRNCELRFVKAEVKSNDLISIFKPSQGNAMQASLLTRSFSAPDPHASLVFPCPSRSLLFWTRLSSNKPLWTYQTVQMFLMQHYDRSDVVQCSKVFTEQQRRKLF